MLSRVEKMEKIVVKRKLMRRGELIKVCVSPVTVSMSLITL